MIYRLILFHVLMYALAVLDKHRRQESTTAVPLALLTVAYLHERFVNTTTTANKTMAASTRVLFIV